MSRVSSIDIGSIKVTSLLDGELVLPAEVLLNLKDEDLQIIKDNAENALTSSNIMLILFKVVSVTYLLMQGVESYLVRHVASFKMR